MLMGTLDGASCGRNGDLVSFSTAFTPDQCWDSEKRPGEVCVTISVNLTKDFGLAKRVGWGGW